MKLDWIFTLSFIRLSMQRISFLSKKLSPFWRKKNKSFANLAKEISNLTSALTSRRVTLLSSLPKSVYIFCFPSQKAFRTYQNPLLIMALQWNSYPKNARLFAPQRQNTFPQCLTASPHSLSASPQQGKGIQRRWNPIHRWRASFPQRWNANLQRLNPCSTETTFKLKWKAPKILRGWIPSCSLGTLDCSLNIQTFIEWLQCQIAVKAILHGRVLSLHRVIAKLQAGDTSLRPWKASLQWK